MPRPASSWPRPRPRRDLDPWQQANLREMRRKYRHAHALEPALVEALARATTACEMTWREARAKSDFAMLAPQLTEVVRLVARGGRRHRRRARACSPYDALLDAYQPDLRDADVVPLFDRLAAELPPLLDAVLARQAAAPAAVRPTGPFPARSAEGARPRADGPARASTSMPAGSTRARTRSAAARRPTSASPPATARTRSSRPLMGVLHETGHALYEAGLPRALARPAGGRGRGASPSMRASRC